VVNKPHQSHLRMVLTKFLLRIQRRDLSGGNIKICKPASHTASVWWTWNYELSRTSKRRPIFKKHPKIQIGQWWQRKLDFDI